MKVILCDTFCSYSFEIKSGHLMSIDKVYEIIKECFGVSKLKLEQRWEDK